MEDPLHGKVEGLDLFIRDGGRIGQSPMFDLSLFPKRFSEQVAAIGSTLLDGVGVIAAFQDRERLEKADQYLEEASKIMDATGDKQCQDDGWVRNYKKQIERSLQALKQWMTATKDSKDSSLESDLELKYSIIESISRRLQDIITRSSNTESV